ncbi:metallophosphoesterase family protein [Trichloromonas sp.]|uniref:metallophosphoesterase family protein n=1 Tax=Trichloromonas sp. TaxID=3069249 RepID=UPI003D81C2DF
MTSGRLLAVGDIHGCRDLLVDLLAKVRPQPADRLIFLGDYIDRGPDARGVIDELLTFRLSHPRSIFLKGNHEAMFLDFLAGRNLLLFLRNGGDATLSSYPQEGKIRIPQEHLDFLRNLDLHHETEDFIFVHAGLRPGLPLADQQERDLLWIRSEFLDSDYDWGKTLVFGHTPFAAPLLTANRIGLDTGAVYGRTLSCCDVRSRTCWHAP